jgi:glycosyltransferase involved in cell wall biosynthesis
MSKLVKIIAFPRRLARFIKYQGLKGALRAVMDERRSRRENSDRDANLIGPEFLDLPDTIEVAVQGEEAINWIIPVPGKGSGGHSTIFRMVRSLEDSGHKCNLIIYGSEEAKLDFKQLKKNTLEWFDPVNALLIPFTGPLPKAKAYIATNWISAYWLRSVVTNAKKIYFVQDYEPWFYERSSNYFFARETYNFGFTHITAGEWLAEKLKGHSDTESRSIKLAHIAQDSKIARGKLSGRPKILLYVRPSTGRRGLELGLATLEHLHRSGFEFHANLIGAEKIPANLKFPYTNFGIVRQEDLPSIYDNSDAALVLSLTNLSLLPVELMAHGVPVISNSGYWLDWFLNTRNSQLADPTPEALAEAITLVLGNDSRRLSIISQGFADVEHLDWASEGMKFCTFVEEIIND